MAKVKIKNIKTGAVKEVEKSLASDFIGTQKFELFQEHKQRKPFITEEQKKIFPIKEEKNVQD